MTLASFLRRYRRVALDTSIFIYHLEDDARCVDRTGLVFDWVGRDRNSAVASTITMAELLVRPYQLDNEECVNQFYALLTTSPHGNCSCAHRLVTNDAASARALRC